MTRSVRLLIVGLLSAMLTLGMTTTSAVAAPAVSGRAAPTAGCLSAQQQDAAAAAAASQAESKFKKAKKQYRKAVKLNKKQSTVKHKKAVKKAKKKKNKAKKRVAAAKANRVNTSNQFIVFCGTTPAGAPGTPGAPLPPSTPGVSPLAPLCVAVPQLQPLCDATAALGNTSPLQPLCDAIPQLAPLCAVKPGDLADPAQVQALLALIAANLPQGAGLLTFVGQLVTQLLSGNLQGVAATLGTTPAVLAQLLRALGIPIPAVPGLPLV